MKHIAPVRAKILMILFFSTGILGIVIGLSIAPPTVIMIITFMGVVNFGLGAFFAYVVLTQGERVSERQKRKRRGRGGGSGR